MSDTTSLKIKYINICGLDKKKFNYLINEITNNNIDIIFVAEHWYSNIDSYSKHPYFITSTNYTKKVVNSRQSDGILLLGNPKYHNLINEITSKEFSIKIKIDNRYISALYLPPRLKIIDIITILEENKSHIIFGDMNFKIGTINNDLKIENVLRKDKIIDFTSTYLLKWIKSSSTPGKWNHLFSKSDMIWHYTILPRNILNTNHGLISFDFILNQKVLLNNNIDLSEDLRYNLNDLDDFVLQMLIIEFWESKEYNKINRLIERCKKSHIKIEDIDNIYNKFTEGIINVLDNHLGKYNANTIQFEPDTILAKLEKSTNPNDVQRLFKKLCRKKKVKLIPSDPDKNVFDEGKDRFKSLYNDNDTIDDSLNYNSYNLDIKITEKMVTDVILKYPISKSGGPDQIHTRILVVLIQSFLFRLLLTKLINLFFKSCITPSAWNEASITLIPKNVNDLNILKSRPISLTNILRRLFEKLVLKEIKELPSMKISICQAGFQTGYSTMSNIILSEETTEDYPISAFLDLKSAYDVVNWNKLKDILKKRKIPKNIYILIDSLLFQNQSSKLIINNTRCRTIIQRKRGLLQGSILSPIIFNIFIDELAIKLGSIENIIRLFFADDIKIKSKTDKNLQEALSICDNWARDNLMIFSIDKCGIINSNTKFYLGEIEIQNLISYKYLGINFKKNGFDFKEHLEKQLQKSSSMFNFIAIQSINVKSNMKLILFKSFIRSLTDYCLGITSIVLKKKYKKDYKDLIKIGNLHYFKVSKWIIGKTASFHNSLILTGIGTFQQRMLEMESSVSYHFNTLHSDNQVQNIRPKLLIKNLKQNLYIEEFKQKNSNFLVNVISWKTFLNEKRIDNILKSKRVLPFYHLESPDNILKVDREIFDIGIKYRINSLFMARNTRCCCKEIFNRRHIISCFSFENNPKIVEIISSVKYQKQKDYLEERFYKYFKKEKEFHFNILDYLLNINDYHTFIQATKIIQALLN